MKEGIFEAQKLKDKENEKKIREEMAALKETFEPLFQTINPQRLWMGKYTKLNLHQSEVEKIVNRMKEAYHGDNVQAMRALNREDGLCKGFANEMRDLKDQANGHIAYFQEMIDHAIGHPNDLTGKNKLNPIKSAWDFNTHFNAFMQKNIECYKKNVEGEVGKVKAADELSAKIHHELMEKSDYRSIDCYMRFMHNRVRYWKIVTHESTERQIGRCQERWAQLKDDRNKIIRTDDGTNKWTTPKAKYAELSNDRLDENREKYHAVLEFLRKWNNCDDSLYDETMKPAKRIAAAKVALQNALEISYYYYAMGEAAKEEHDTDGKKTRAYIHGNNITRYYARKFKVQCANPLLLTIERMSARF